MDHAKTRDMIRAAPATEADGPALAELRVEAMRPSLEAAGRFDPDRARRRFLDGFQADDTVILRGLGGIIGFYVLRVRADHLYLDHLYIRPSCQGGGIGRSVVENLKDRSCAADLPIRLMALKGSPANEFYLSCGFSAVSADVLDIRYEWRPDS